ncbi:O-antigen polymerase [uncultured Stenotrophomonas sp.]|uniref:O-antigen polymerase n=1 Tax=uncultured Stenotrophomonas sp. TaxID=165438 RepID=A0A1Y5Q7Z9_9GAMM|nr:O-antigen polymerase [uncultured Stenotrophomonas sp.]
MNLLPSTSLCAESTGRRWWLLHLMATSALFLLPTLVLSLPANLLPFGLLLVLTSLFGIDYLWRARLPGKQVVRLLAGLAVVVVALGMVSAWGSDRSLREMDKVSRFLVMPWAALWVCALRPSRQALWWGAWVGLFATLAIAVAQVVGGQARAEAWTNAIVLADVSLVLMVLLVFCRAPGHWGWIVAGMAAGGCVILLSGSRGAWPAMLALLLALVFSLRWGRGHVRLAMLSGLVLATAVLLLAVPGLREQTRLAELHNDVQRLEQGDMNSSAGARLELLHVAWDTFRERPWTGIGIGHFDKAMQRLPDCMRQVNGSESRCHLGHAHNDVAEWAATQGIPGLLLLLAVYGLPLWLFVHLHRHSSEDGFRGPAAAGVMLVVAYALCGLTQSMFAHQITTTTYATLVGVLCALSLVEAAGAGVRAECVAGRPEAARSAATTT